VEGALHDRREFLALSTAALGAVHPHARKHKRRRRRRPRDPLTQVDHIVLVMQENCSFDRYFGTLRGVRGFSDPDPALLSNGKTVFHQPYAAGVELLPWRLDASAANPCDVIADNGWGPLHAALNGGRMDAWLSAQHELPYTMSYYAREDVPWHMALADAFTVGDAYFSSVLGATDPNRVLSMTGTIDPTGLAGGPVIDNTRSQPYTFTTYPERLQAKGISWRVYQQEDNFEDNALEWFKVYQQAQPGSPLYENGMRRRPASAFADDVAAGTLPKVSWLIAPTHQSEHPGNAPGPGADFCNSALQALFAHPKVWRKTVVILNYDEAGGFFDHVLPPLPPLGTPGEFVGAEPVGLGFRVPLVVCSPWSRGGFVCSHTFDHTSVLRLIERRFGVREPQISAWRRRVCGDLTACLDLRHPDFSIPPLPATAPLAAAHDFSCKNRLPGLPPLLSQQVPVQEPGTRPRRG
jgi:phospholipase C